MKKFISMVMAAAMVVSLVPATAFAYEASATAKILDVAEMTEDQAKDAKEDGIDSLASEEVDQPELQVKMTGVEYTQDETPADAKYEFDLKLDNAEWDGFVKGDEDYAAVKVTIVPDAAPGTPVELTGAAIAFSDVDKDEATVTITCGLQEDDKVVIDLSKVLVTKTASGSEATVTIKSSDLGVDAADMVFAVVQDNVLEIDVDDTTDIAMEEPTAMEDITIEAATGMLPSDLNKTEGDDTYDLKLKLSKGFEFDKENVDKRGTGFRIVAVDDNVAYVSLNSEAADKIEIVGLKIEAVSANAGDVATLTVSASEWESASVEIATVVAEGLTISVDEDEDVPEMWSGVLPESVYLTDDCENEALTITIEETVAGSFDEKDEVELVLPEGVWVVGATANSVEGDFEADKDIDTEALEVAYQEGDHASFIFEKRTIGETTETGMEVEIDLVLVADPGFVGDVVVEMLVDGESVGEVTVATFKAPIIVEAEQNDLKIDYRNTEVGSDIVVKEAEAGLWSTELSLGFVIDKFEANDFEDDMVYTVNEDESGMEIDGKDEYLFFEIDEESDDEAGEVVISNISLYMDRNLAAGAYDLKMYGDCFDDYKAAHLFAKDCDATDCDGDRSTDGNCEGNKDAECIIDDVADIDGVVKEAFINIVTAGREADDASFTTKVVVPVGESYIIAGEQTIALDVPAYVSAAGYTMLPVRAVATGLGINNNNVLWDQTTKTVTILYGQRIITMVAGQKVVNVNGSVIPASATVEIVDGRAFLPMRDLATALGVTDITWDAATKTATLNGNA